MINPSRATINAPAGDPNRITDVKTKVSEMEMVAGTEGSRTVADPLRSVRAARVNQPEIHSSVRLAQSRWAEFASTAKPATVIRATYEAPGRGRRLDCCIVPRGRLRELPADVSVD